MQSASKRRISEADDFEAKRFRDIYSPNELTHFYGPTEVAGIITYEGNLSPTSLFPQHPEAEVPRNIFYYPPEPFRYFYNPPSFYSCPTPSPTDNQEDEDEEIDVVTIDEPPQSLNETVHIDVLSMSPRPSSEEPSNELRESENAEDDVLTANKIRKWAKNTNQTANSVNSLMKLLKTSDPGLQSGLKRYLKKTQRAENKAEDIFELEMDRKDSSQSKLSSPRVRGQKASRPQAKSGIYSQNPLPEVFEISRSPSPELAGSKNAVLAPPKAPVVAYPHDALPQPMMTYPPVPPGVEQYLFRLAKPAENVIPDFLKAYLVGVGFSLPIETIDEELVKLEALVSDNKDAYYSFVDSVTHILAYRYSVENDLENAYRYTLKVVFADMVLVGISWIPHGDKYNMSKTKIMEAFRESGIRVVPEQDYRVDKTLRIALSRTRSCVLMKVKALRAKKLMALQKKN